MEQDEKALEAERAELQRMVESEGWRIFCRNTQAQLDNLRAHGWGTIKTMEQLWYAKGCMDTMMSAISLDKLLAVPAQQDWTEIDA